MRDRPDSTGTLTELEGLPTLVVIGDQDQVIPPELQRAFAAALGVSPIEIASVHAAFTFRPQELADILASLAA